MLTSTRVKALILVAILAAVSVPSAVGGQPVFDFEEPGYLSLRFRAVGDLELSITAQMNGNALEGGIFLSRMGGPSYQLTANANQGSDLVETVIRSDGFENVSVKTGHDEARSITIVAGMGVAGPETASYELVAFVVGGVSSWSFILTGDVSAMAAMTGTQTIRLTEENLSHGTYARVASIPGAVVVARGAQTEFNVESRFVGAAINDRVIGIYEGTLAGPDGEVDCPCSLGPGAPHLGIGTYRLTFDALALRQLSPNAPLVYGVDAQFPPWPPQ